MKAVATARASRPGPDQRCVTTAVASGTVALEGEALGLSVGAQRSGEVWHDGERLVASGAGSHVTTERLDPLPEHW